MSQRGKQIISVVGIVILILAFLQFQYNIFGFSEEKGPAESTQTGNMSQNPATPVRFVQVDPRAFQEKVKVTGSVMANESVELRSETNGKVDLINFKEGDRVRKGQLLVSINVDDLRAQLERARYTQKLRENTEYRQQQLLEREAISQEEYDLALTELKTAQADVRILEASIAKSEIRAPFDGIIGLRKISMGSYISPNTEIANLYNINPAKIEFALPGKYVDRIQEGNEINFTVEAVKDEFIGTIYAIEPQIDQATRTVNARAITPNPDLLLKPGQFADIAITLDVKQNAILVPSQSIIPELNGHKVFVAENGSALERNVKVGTRTETQVEILDGLKEGDTVITSGLLQIRQGSPVSLIQ
jgi:membrane fusion protein (multidrug efflux system)